MDFVLGRGFWNKCGPHLCWGVDGRALCQLQVLSWARGVYSLITLALSGVPKTSAREGGPCLAILTQVQPGQVPGRAGEPARVLYSVAL